MVPGAGEPEPEPVGPGGEQPTGTFTTFESTDFVEPQTLGYGELDDGFVWQLPGDVVTPFAEYSIELFEQDSSRNAEPLPSPIPRLPLEDTVEFGIDDTHLKMRVMMVPFDHDLGPGCPEPPDLDAIAFDDVTEAQYFADRLYAHNPVDEVEIAVHQVVPYYGTAEDSGPLLSELRQLREQDEADPGWYYYGLIRPCDNGPDFSGVANLASPERDRASRRTGWGTFRSEGRSANTFVHEIGHEQGRSHVACSGQEARPDPDYPNDTGDIDGWGWDVNREDRILDPAWHDYMSYCGNSWVGAYGWNLVYPWIAEISSWELEHAVIKSEQLLHVMVHPSGDQDAWIGSGKADAEKSKNHWIDFYRGTVLVARHFAEFEPIDKGSSFQLSVIVPDAYDQVTSAAFSDGTGIYPIDLGQVRRFR
jgi:hypothetical protein